MRVDQIITAITDSEDNPQELFAIYFGTSNELYDHIVAPRVRMTEVSITDGRYFGLKHTEFDTVEWLHNTPESAEEQRTRFNNPNYIVIGLNFRPNTK